MKTITHKFRHYTAVLEPDAKNGGFTVIVPALPGCISEGDTFEEAIVNIEEAAELYVEVMRSHKAEVPQEDMGIILRQLPFGRNVSRLCQKFLHSNRKKS